MTRLIQSLSVLLLVFLISCTDSDDNDSSSSTDCSGVANYIVTFESTWSSTTHPSNFPDSPHFSGLIGGTHNEHASFWSVGSAASDGMEDMAETGGKNILADEIESSISDGNAISVLSGGNIALSPGSVSLDFNISSVYPYVTLVSMIAPSPDWFVGVSGLNLCQNGNWVSSEVVDLYAYDAGTDSGATYTAADKDTSPQGAITELNTGVFKVNGVVPTLGTFTFELVTTY